MHSFIRSKYLKKKVQLNMYHTQIGLAFLSNLITLIEEY